MMNDDYYIFLDIDEVLTTNSSNFKLCDTYLSNLKKLVDQFNAKIVLISSWRSYFRKINDRILPTNYKLGRELIQRLSNYKLRIDDLVAERESVETSRGVEIVNYLDRFNIKNYVIIDDELHDFKELNLVNHVQTLAGNYVDDKPEDQGFNEKALLQAIQYLRNNKEY